jgi:hypothetical protein
VSTDLTTFILFGGLNRGDLKIFCRIIVIERIIIRF